MAYLCSILIHAVSLVLLALFVLRAMIEGGAPEAPIADTQITVSTETPLPVVSPPPVKPPVPVPRLRPRPILAVTAKLAAPFDLRTMLREVVIAEALPPTPVPSARPTVAPTVRPTVAPTPAMVRVEPGSLTAPVSRRRP